MPRSLAHRLRQLDLARRRRSRSRRPPRSCRPSSCVTCTRPRRPSAVPWRGDVGRGRAARAQEPLRHRRVQAAGDRVLDRGAVLGEERAHLEGRLGARRVAADDADVQVDDTPGASASTASASAAGRRPSPGRCRPTGRRRSSSRVDAEQPRAIRSTSASSTGPERTQRRCGEREPAGRRAGSARARRRTPARWRRRACGAPPASSQAWHVPSVGCPANGSSATGVKMRTR